MVRWYLCQCCQQELSVTEDSLWQHILCLGLWAIRRHAIGLGDHYDTNPEASKPASWPWNVFHIVLQSLPRPASRGHPQSLWRKLPSRNGKALRHQPNVSAWEGWQRTQCGSQPAGAPSFCSCLAHCWLEGLFRGKIIRTCDTRPCCGGESTSRPLPRARRTPLPPPPSAEVQAAASDL